MKLVDKRGKLTKEGKDYLENVVDLEFFNNILSNDKYKQKASDGDYRLDQNGFLIEGEHKATEWVYTSELAHVYWMKSFTIHDNQIALVTIGSRGVGTTNVNYWAFMYQQKQYPKMFLKAPNDTWYPGKTFEDFLLIWQRLARYNKDIVKHNMDLLTKINFHKLKEVKKKKFAIMKKYKEYPWKQ